jgi:hypothetical protein
MDYVEIRMKIEDFYREEAGAQRVYLAVIFGQLAALREQLAATTARAQRFDEALVRIAAFVWPGARVEDYISEVVQRYVADALGITVEELGKRLEDNG